MTDESDDFDGCSRLCRKRGAHTLKWGDCDLAVEPPRREPEFGFWRTFDAGDGCMSITMATIPLLAVLPWAANLTVDQRHEMLEETATAEDPAAVIKKWKRRADARAPIQINMLPAREPDPGYGPMHLREAYERGRRQGRYKAGG
jgi:hypothetical protein